eukprot:6469953-Prymnesium_polylepis.1
MLVAALRLRRKKGQVDKVDTRTIRTVLENAAQRMWSHQDAALVDGLLARLSEQDVIDGSRTDTCR